MARSRSYVFTINNYTEEDEHQVFGLHWDFDATYVVAGKEVGGEKGTPHLQCYVHFSQPKSLKQVSEMLPRARIAAKRGTHKEASDYCKKDGDYYEWGKLPADDFHKAGGEATRLLWQDTLDCIRNSDYIAVPVQATHLIKHAEYRVGRERMQNRDLTPLKVLRHLWIYSPTSGSGKTASVDSYFPGKYWYDHTDKWFEDYKGEDEVYLDDFDKYQRAKAGDLKRWVDHRPFRAQIKGGSLGLIRPKRIIVTSNYHPDEIWDDEVTRSCLNRRFIVVQKNHLHLTLHQEAQRQFIDLKMDDVDLKEAERKYFENVKDKLEEIGQLHLFHFEFS